jgi:hypothetical protein
MNKQDDEEYLLFIPFYGYQRQGKSFKEGYGLIAYWNEYNDEDRRTERSVLFPLFNWYTSPTTSGWRALPILTWYKFHSENGSEYRRLFTAPFYYHSSRTNSADRSIVSSFWLTPLSYYSYTNENGTESTSWNPTIPVFGGREHITKTVTALPAVKNQTAAFTEKAEGSSRSWFFPVWYSHDTFDSDSENKTSGKESFYFLLPLFGGYSSGSTSDSKKEESDYFAFFPAFIPLYISESYRNSYTQRTEKSILWPIFNSYETPDSSGWRIFPAVWHKYQKENSIEYRKTVIVPLLSIKTSETDAQGKTLSSFMLNPLFYYSFENYGSTRTENWSTTIPIMGKRSSETVETSALPQAKASDTGSTAAASRRGSLSSWFIPFFYTSEESSEDGRSGNSIHESTQLALPLFYRHTITLSSAARPEEKTTDSTLFLFGFYRQSSTAGPGSSSLLGGLYSYTASGTDWSHSLLWSLGKVSSENMNFTFYLHPLWYYENDSGMKSFYLLFGLFHMMRDNANSSGDTSAFWWVFNTSLYNGSRIYDRGEYRPASDRTTWAFPLFCYSSTRTTDAGAPAWSTTFWAPIIPLIYYHNENDSWHLNIAALIDMENTENSGFRYWTIPFFFLDSSNEGYCHLLPLWIYSWDKGEKTANSASLLHYYERMNIGTKNEEMTFWAPVIPLSYWHSSADSTHFNLLGFIDIENNRREKNWNGWLAPLFFGRSGDDGYLHILPPLFLTSWNNAEKDSWQFVLGMYHHTAPDFTRWNYLGLWDWQEKTSQHYSDWSLLLSSFEVEHTPDLTSMRAVWGLLADAEFSTKSTDYSLNGILYLAGMSRQGDSFQSRILPLWYYEHERESYTLVVPPFLTYWDREDDGSCHQIVGLGALWTRWYSPAEHSDLQLALLGIPYYKTQKEEKGYESSGVLWGLIFDHESESETGYESFSILKFVYKQVTLGGKTYRSIFGIRSEDDNPGAD